MHRRGGLGGSAALPAPAGPENSVLGPAPVPVPGFCPCARPWGPEGGGPSVRGPRLSGEALREQRGARAEEREGRSRILTAPGESPMAPWPPSRPSQHPRYLARGRQAWASGSG